MDDLLNTIANVGFPIAMATYLLIRIETKLEKLSEGIFNLSQNIENLK